MGLIPSLVLLLLFGELQASLKPFFGRFKPDKWDISPEVGIYEPHGYKPVQRGYGYGYGYGYYDHEPEQQGGYGYYGYQPQQYGYYGGYQNGYQPQHRGYYGGYQNGYQPQQHGYYGGYQQHGYQPERYYSASDLHELEGSGSSGDV